LYSVHSIDKAIRILQLLFSYNHSTRMNIFVLIGLNRFIYFIDFAILLGL